MAINYESLPVKCSNVVEKHICYEGWHYFLDQDEARLKKILKDESNDICLKLYKTALLIQGRNILLVFVINIHVLLTYYIFSMHLNHIFLLKMIEYEHLLNYLMLFENL